jgi:hypothetical protein
VEPFLVTPPSPSSYLSFPLSLLHKMNKRSYVVAASVFVGPMLIAFQMSVLNRIADPGTKNSLSNFIALQAVLIATFILFLIHYHLYKKIIAYTVNTTSTTATSPHITTLITTPYSHNSTLITSHM